MSPTQLPRRGLKARSELAFAATAMAAAMASKTISRALLGFESPALRRAAPRWHPSTRCLCWARKIPNAQVMAAVERPTHGTLDRVTLTRRVPSLKYGMKGGLKVEKEKIPTGVCRNCGKFLWQFSIIFVV